MSAPTAEERRLTDWLWEEAMRCYHSDLPAGDWDAAVRTILEPLRAAEREKQELRRVLGLALIPLAVLVVSGECVDAPTALTEELKLAIIEAHDEVLRVLRPKAIRAEAEALLGRKP